MPGTHIKPSEASEEEEGLLCAGPAGTLAIHHQSIVHRRARQMDEAEGVYRHMLKYLPRQTFLLILSPCRSRDLSLILREQVLRLSLIHI